MSGLTPVSSNSRQCGQVSDPYSITLTFALGLPISIPPSGVWVTIVVQSPFFGGLTGVIFTGAFVAASPCFELQPATAISAAAQARKVVGFINSLGSLDHGYVGLGLLGKRRRSAGSGNLRGKRLQAGAQL